MGTLVTLAAIVLAGFLFRTGVILADVLLTRRTYEIARDAVREHALSLSVVCANMRG